MSLKKTIDNAGANVSNYINTSYDVVKLVSDNIEAVKTVAECIDTLGCNVSYTRQESNDIFATIVYVDEQIALSAGLWSQNINDIYYTTGNVGIGTANPEGLLHLYSGDAGTFTVPAEADELVIEGSGNVGIFLRGGTGFNEATGLYFYSANNFIRLRGNGEGADLEIGANDGAVAIFEGSNLTFESTYYGYVQIGTPSLGFAGVEGAGNLMIESRLYVIGGEIVLGDHGTPDDWHSGWRAIEIGENASLSASKTSGVMDLANNFWNSGTNQDSYQNDGYASAIHFEPAAGTITIRTAPSGLEDDEIFWVDQMQFSSSGVTGASILDEDTMVSNSAFHLATQQSIRAYVLAQAGSSPWVAVSNDIYYDLGSVAIGKTTFAGWSATWGSLEVGATGAIANGSGITIVGENTYWNAGYKYITADVASILSVTNGTVTIATATAGAAPGDPISWNVALTVLTSGHLQLDSGLLQIAETAAAVGAAGYGQIWVKDDAPTTLWYTDDDGTDFMIGGLGASGIWTQAVNDIYYTLGNVSIGTTEVTRANLHVSSGDSTLAASLTSGFNEFMVESANDAGMTIMSPNTGIGGIAFGDPDNRSIGRLEYDHATDYLSIWVNNAVSAVFEDTGKLNLNSAVNPALEIFQKGASSFAGPGGEFWVKNTFPSEAFFTDSAGADFLLNLSPAEQFVYGKVRLAGIFDIYGNNDPLTSGEQDNVVTAGVLASLGASRYKHMVAGVNINNVTAMTTLSDLILSIEGQNKYAVEVVFRMRSDSVSACGVKAQVDFATSQGVGTWTWISGNNYTVHTIVNNNIASFQPTEIEYTNGAILKFEGVLFGNGGDTSFTVKVAQFAAEVGNLQFQAGSYIKVTRLIS